MRKQLLAENKLSRYIIYAVGEIILVMIGILLALQVNNWNEVRKDRLAEQGFLERLLDDLKADTIAWNNALYLTNIKKNFLFDVLNNQLNSIRQDDFQQFLFTSRFRQLPIANKSTFQELTSNGKVGLIKNTELKESILRYYGFIADRNIGMQSTFSEWPRLISELIPGQLHYNTRADRNLELSHEEIMDIIDRIQSNRELIEPAINAELGYTGVQYRSYNEINRRATNLLDQLSLELKSK